MAVNATNKIVRQTAEHTFETLDDSVITTRLSHVERAAQNEQDARDTMGEMELNPRLKLFSKSRGRNAHGADTTRLAGMLKFLG
jgi:hypothetical protein